MSKAFTTESAIKGPEMTMLINPNEKTNGLNYVQKNERTKK